MSNAATVRRNADIRAWARTQGIELGGTGRIPNEVRAAYADRDEDDQAGELDAAAIAAGIGAGDQPLPLEIPGETPGEPVPANVSRETAPERPAPGEPKRRGRWGRPKAGEPAAVVVGPKRPARRRPLDTLVSGAWTAAAHVVSYNPRQLPVARVLDLQAPVAGSIADQLIAGTVLDRLLQPLARAGDKGEAVFALVGPPLLVAAITNQPGLYPVLAPVLAAALESWADIAGPEVKKRQEKAAKRRESGFDIEAMLEMIFAPAAAEPDGAEGAQPAA